SGWIPASMNESYEIIRRRLFQELDVEGARSRDATVAAFHKLYRDSKTDFPSEVSEAAYKDTLALSYPIHPELFLQLSATWGPLERFQKTRGVLRLMANVIYALWRRDDQAPLILPSSLPLTDERVRASILDPLQGQYASILDAEVEGDQARPQQIEARRTGYGRTQALTRAARAVFVATAPQGGVGNVGITGPRLRLSCATPADQINIFGDALRELSETSADTIVPALIFADVTESFCNSSEPTAPFPISLSIKELSKTLEASTALICNSNEPMAPLAMSLSVSELFWISKVPTAPLAISLSETLLS
ncbi:MAG: DUF499 domain-containing protein, partial [Hyphomicrobium sp.]